jgi:hypothetical protein
MIDCYMRYFYVSIGTKEMKLLKSRPISDPMDFSGTCQLVEHLHVYNTSLSLVYLLHNYLQF